MCRMRVTGRGTMQRPHGGAVGGRSRTFTADRISQPDWASRVCAGHARTRSAPLLCRGIPHRSSDAFWTPRRWGPRFRAPLLRTPPPLAAHVRGPRLLTARTRTPQNHGPNLIGERGRARERERTKKWGGPCCTAVRGLAVGLCASPLRACICSAAEGCGKYCMQKGGAPVVSVEGNGCEVHCAGFGLLLMCCTPGGFM